jgi:uncharacterized protein YjbI with pentapeptide repeats
LKAQFPEADLSEAQFPYASLSEAEFPEADLSEAQFPYAYLGKAEFPDAYLPGAEFPDAYLPGAEFPNARLWRSEFPDTYLLGAEFHNANLRRAEFPDAILWRSEFPDADLRRAEFSRASLYETVLDRADLTKTILTRASLFESSLRAATFRGADATDAVFFRADCERANFRNATLNHANFENARLIDADLGGADFTDARLYQTLFIDAQIDSTTQFDATTVYERTPNLLGWFRGTANAEPLQAAAWVYRRLQQLYEDNAMAETAREYHLNKEEAERTFHARRAAAAADEAQETPAESPNDGDERRRLFDGFETSTATHEAFTRSLLYHGPTFESLPEKVATTTRKRQSRRLAERTAERDERLATQDTEPRPSPIQQELYHTGRWTVKTINRYLTNHGESVEYVLRAWAAVIVASALLYPFTGGFASSTTDTTYRLGLGDFVPPDVVEIAGTLAQSLYFSVITFSTIGYGDLYPTGTLTKVLVGIESLAGALLIALLVFVLGRQVAR